jgi:hypothetical protein
MEDRTTGLPHVTDILRDAGLIDTAWFTDEARDRGTAVHAAIHYLLDGDLDESSLVPDVAARVDGFRNFMAQVALVVFDHEQRVQDAVIGYCGTLDLRCLINARKAVVDYKNGAPAAWHPIQLAAYAGALDEAYDRYALYLNPDFPNGYKLVQYRDRNDWKVFCAALTIANFKRSSHVR